MIQSTKKEQIYKLLKERIERRVYVPGSRLPKEVELSAELGVSERHCVRFWNSSRWKI